jgi:hypothetical protein
MSCTPLTRRPIVKRYAAKPLIILPNRPYACQWRCPCRLKNTFFVYVIILLFTNGSRQFGLTIRIFNDKLDL